MSKQRQRVTEIVSSEVMLPLRWKALAFFGASAMLIGIVWLYTQRISHTPAWGHVFGIAAIHALLTVALERALEAVSLRREESYRLAFFGSLSVFGVQWFVLLFASSPSLSLLWWLAAAGGAFAGGLLATGLNERLSENNSPPSDRIREEVHRRHLEVIGAPPRIDPLKRIFDILLASAGLVLSSPVWLLISFLIWIEEPGPLIFVKNSVGRGGINFHQFKFRTMVRGAEERTGPVMASQEDERVLAIGRFLRKTALDELPQLLNILRGEMSFVGPRPQRTVLVISYLEIMPEYAERHQVLPGLAGLAQVAGDYYLTPRQKLRFDRLYIRYANLGFDLKLIFLAFAIAFWYRWKKDWNGRLPRKLLRFGRKKAGTAQGF